MCMCYTALSYVLGLKSKSKSLKVALAGVFFLLLSFLSFFFFAKVLEVRRCMAGTPAFGVVETGDIILAVEGRLVTRFRVSGRAGEQEIPSPKL